MTETAAVKRAAAILISLVASACNDHHTPAAAYRHWTDRLTSAVGLPAFSCFREKTIQGQKVSASIPVDECYRMEPAKRWKGLWRHEFEGSRFCPAPATECSFHSPGDRIWLDAPVRFPGSIEKRRLGGLYAIEFVGRKTRYGGRYGHMGVFDDEIIVDRLISIREVEAPPKPSKSDLASMEANCRAIPNCSVEELEKILTAN